MLVFMNAQNEVNGCIIEASRQVRLTPTATSTRNAGLERQHMRLDHSSTLPESRQLSLFTDNQTDDRPLPLLVADKWSFALRTIEHSETILYCLHDWIVGLTNSKNVNQVIKNYLHKGVFSKNFTADDVEFVDDKTLYRITQEMRVTKTRPAVAAIKEYLADAGAFTDEVRRNPAAAIDAGINGYRRRGKSEQFIDQRVKGIQSRNIMTDTMKATITDAIDYARITRLEYRGLFKRTLGELLSQMKARSFRDNTTHHALYYLNLLEETYTVAMARIEKASLEEACQIMQDLSDQIGAQVEATSKLLGIDIATGKALLKDGKQ